METVNSEPTLLQQLVDNPNLESPPEVMPPPEDDTPETAIVKAEVFSTDMELQGDTIVRKLELPKKPSLFNVITGPRGSLKTLLLTVLAARNLLKCFYLRRYYGITRHVWTNYPIAFFHRSIVDGKIYYLKPEPLNMESLYTFDKGLADGWVYIDEIDQWYDRQDWAAITQKLTNAVITQIRKRQLSLSATTQNFQWLNARAQFQTDTLIGCREAAFTVWGRKNHVRMGEISFLSLKDLSGVNTGYTFEETKRAYNARLTHGSRIWNIYDTNYQFDPTETKVRYKMKTDVKTITMHAGQGYEISGEQISAQNSQPDTFDSKNDMELALFSHIVEDFREDGVYRVPAGEMWNQSG